MVCPRKRKNTLRSCYPNDTEREGPNPLCDPCSTVHTLCRSSVGKHASLRAAGNALQVSCVSQAYYAATRRSKATAPERLSQAILAMPPRSAAGQRNPNRGKRDGTLSLHRFFSKGGQCFTVAVGSGCFTVAAGGLQCVIVASVGGLQAIIVAVGCGCSSVRRDISGGSSIVFGGGSASGGSSNVFEGGSQSLGVPGSQYFVVARRFSFHGPRVVRFAR